MNNWGATVPGKGWFGVFRLYGPLKGYISKDPGPEGPALGYPWKGVVYMAIFLWEYWSAGVVEYWKSNEQKPLEHVVI
ncbi:MAG: hypothetical protein JRF22_07065 [Deltaproteobacteria bacterium]|nr:hypothetical protein [Deltaproteobacteria bacterium]